MTVITLRSSEWHHLTQPVIPHASTDKEEPALAVIRLETRGGVAYAVAFDRYALAAERLRLGGDSRHAGDAVIHARLADIKASLTLFGWTKERDQPLRLTIDTVPVPVRAAGRDVTIRQLALTIDADDGTRLVMHDQRDPANDPLATWHARLSALLQRDGNAAPAPACFLAADRLGRWARAVRKGERLAMIPGDAGNKPILVMVEDHFAGAWMPVALLETPAEMAAQSPWAGELVGMHGHADELAEVRRRAAASTGEAR